MKHVSAIKAKLPALRPCVRLSLQLDLCMPGCITCQLRRCVTHHDGYLFCLRLQTQKRAKDLSVWGASTAHLSTAL